MVGKLVKLSDFLDKLVMKLVFLLIAGMVLTTTLQVVFRVFFDALTFSEELSRYLLVWSTFFGASMAYKRGNHIALTVIMDRMSKKVKSIMAIINYLISIFFFAYVMYYGYQMIKLQIFQISPALSIPMQYIYLSIPLSLLIMIVHSASGIGQEIQRFRGGVN